MPVNSKTYQRLEEPLVINQPSITAGGKLASALPIRNTEYPDPGPGRSSYRSEPSVILPIEEVAPASPTVADVSLKLAAARQAAYPEPVVQRKRSSSALAILLIGLVVFALLFVVGYFVGQFFFFH